MAQAQVGGGAGRWQGPGFVYAMTYTADRTRYYKIGYSGDPDKRLTEIQRDKKNDKIVLVGQVEAIEMNRAETAAQKAVEKTFNFKKIARNATDWYKGRVKVEVVWPVVKKAVEDHNKLMSTIKSKL
jgi:predicted GIY-YIG superfamily endonuclease